MAHLQMKIKRYAKYRRERKMKIVSTIVASLAIYKFTDTKDFRDKIVWAPKQRISMCFGNIKEARGNCSHLIVSVLVADPSCILT